MAKRGPKAKPTRLKLLTGSRRPVNHQEPKPEIGLPRCPRRFGPDQRKLWGVYAKQLTACQIATQIDATALELLIDQHTAYHKASAEVQRTGLVWLEQGEGAIPKFAYSPYWVQQQRAFKQLVAMLREFGMTPSARSSVKTAAPIVEMTDDPASRYFG